MSDSHQLNCFGEATYENDIGIESVKVVTPPFSLYRRIVVLLKHCLEVGDDLSNRYIVHAFRYRLST